MRHYISCRAWTQFSPPPYGRLIARWRHGRWCHHCGKGPCFYSNRAHGFFTSMDYCRLITWASFCKTMVRCSKCQLCCGDKCILRSTQRCHEDCAYVWNMRVHFLADYRWYYWWTIWSLWYNYGSHRFCFARSCQRGIRYLAVNC